tara:strand:+ start:294 stop:545 length:252 start_codon:yes stop_codon:yes gene_type:complete
MATILFLALLHQLLVDVVGVLQIAQQVIVVALAVAAVRLVLALLEQEVLGIHHQPLRRKETTEAQHLLTALHGLLAVVVGLQQ